MPRGDDLCALRRIGDLQQVLVKAFEYRGGDDNLLYRLLHPQDEEAAKLCELLDSFAKEMVGDIWKLVNTPFVLPKDIDWSRPIQEVLAEASTSIGLSVDSLDQVILPDVGPTRTCSRWTLKQIDPANLGTYATTAQKANMAVTRELLEYLLAARPQARVPFMIVSLGADVAVNNKQKSFLSAFKWSGFLGKGRLMLIDWTIRYEKMLWFSLERTCCALCNLDTTLHQNDEWVTIQIKNDTRRAHASCANRLPDECPECGTDLDQGEGCGTCRTCDYTKCY